VQALLQRVDQRQSDLDQMPPCARELVRGEPGPSVGGEQLQAWWRSLMEELRVDSLLPLDPLINELLA
jgi:hypothetical protein